MSEFILPAELESGADSSDLESDAGSADSSLFGDIFGDYTESQEAAMLAADPYVPFMDIASWASFLGNLKPSSNKAYLKATKELIMWSHFEGLGEMPLRSKIVRYLVYLESLLTSDGNRRYGGTFLKVFLGIFKSFYFNVPCDI